jgi:hypothetical protein
MSGRRHLSGGAYPRVSKMKAVVLLSKIALSAVLAFALIVWFESGIEGFPNYCQAEGDINGIIPALSFKHLNAGHPSPNDEYPDKRINSKDPWGNTYQHEMLEDPQNKSVQF